MIKTVGLSAQVSIHGQSRGHAPAIRGKPPPPADVQFHPTVPHWEIRHCGRFREAVGTQVLLALRAAVPLIKVDVRHAGICYVLLALSGREELRLHPHQFEEVKHPLRKKEAEVVLVELCLCSILIHDYDKGTSFHGIYLNGWILYHIRHGYLQVSRKLSAVC